MPSPKPYRDPLLPSKPDEWDHGQNSNGDIFIMKNGRVIRTFRTQEEAREWWNAKFLGDFAENPGEALKRAIERL